MDRRSRITLILCFLLPVPFIVLGLIPCGHAHSLCELAGLLLIFLFPYSVLMLPHDTGANLGFVVLALAQYPVYGSIWYAVGTKTRFRFTGWLILGIHIVGDIIVLIVWGY